MTLTTIRIWTLGLGAIIAPTGLMAQAPIHANIPFDFTVGKKQLAAGEYRVREVAPTVLAVQSQDGKSYAVALVNNSSTRTTRGQVHLTFTRYGDRYFLSEISKSDQAWQLPKSPTEREVAAKLQAPRQVDVIAAAGK
jgi:hypothetical protein